MTLCATLTSLFRSLSFTRRPAAAASASDAQDPRRAIVRQTVTISAACRANGLNNTDRAKVFDAFEELAPQVGMAEARQHACDLAASIASRRRARMNRPTEPWQPTPPAAAA